MNIRRKLFIQEWGISILIFALVIAIFAGSAVYLKPYLANATETASEGIEIITTSNSNIKFSTYFMNENGEKVENLDTEIGETTYLYVDITVLDEGYFNGAISLNNSNFRFVVEEEAESEESTDAEENEEYTSAESTEADEEDTTNDSSEEDTTNESEELNEENEEVSANEEEENEGVSEITENSATLEQINAGETRTIKVKVEPVINSDAENETIQNDLTVSEEESSITLNDLTTTTQINLTGEYVNSKNIEKDKSEEISGSGTVTLRWVSGEEIGAEIEAVLITNSIYEIDSQEKRIVQVLVNSKVTDNSYPVYSSVIKLAVPENIEEIAVTARSTDATNSNAEFGTDNYSYNERENVVEITVENTDTENISWNKECSDTFVVTYIFDVNEYIEEESLDANVTITTYDSKELTAESEVELAETGSLNGVITYSVSSEGEDIYKGMLYTGEDKEYSITSEINVNYLNIVESITLNCNEATYLAGEQEGSANIIYTSAKINKENFVEIFGEDGYLIFKDENGNEVTVTNEIETDEEGNITISFAEETKSIEIRTSEPKATGTLKIEQTKKIMNTGYTRKTIQAMTGIKETVTGTSIAKTSDNGSDDEDETTEGVSEETTDETTDATTEKTIEEVTEETIITLNDTETVASLNVETTSLSTTEEGQELNLRVVLDTSDESKELYTNPTIKIVLPEEIEITNAKYKVVYENGLEKEDAKLSTEDGKSVITITLTGEQTSYLGDAVNGTIIDIIAEVNVDNLSTTKTENIKLYYANETGDGSVGATKDVIEIVAENTMILTNNATGADVTTQGSEETKEVNLALKSEETQETINMQIINNEGTDISDVKILGKIPTNEGNIALASEIELTSENESRATETSETESGEIATSLEATIYYTEVEDANADLSDTSNEWSTTPSTESKNYLIVINTLSKDEGIELSYVLAIAEDLDYSIEEEESYIVEYTNSLTGITSTIKSSTLVVGTNDSATLETTLTAVKGDTTLLDGDVVYEQEMVTYEYTITNTGEEDAEGVDFTITIPNEMTLVQVNNEYDNIYNDVLYLELEDTEINYENITVEAGETLTCRYIARVNEGITDGTQTTAEATVICEDETVTDSITHTLKDAILSVEIGLISGNEEATTYMWNNDEYKVEITNISDEVQENIQVNINNNEIIRSTYILLSDEEEVDSKFTIDSIEPGEKKNIFIYAGVGQATDEINETSIYVTATDNNNNTYTSRKITREAKGAEISLDFIAETDPETTTGFLNAGDTIEYTINIENTGKMDLDALEIRGILSIYLEVQSMTLNGEDVDYNTQLIINDDETVDSQYVYINSTLSEGESAEIEIVASVIDFEINKDIKISNQVTVYNSNIELSQSDEIYYYISNNTNSSSDEGEDSEEQENDGDMGNSEEDDEEDDNGTTNNEEEEEDEEDDNTTEDNEEDDNTAENSEEEEDDDDDTTNVEEEDDDVSDDDDEEEDNTESSSEESSVATYSILGIAWVDADGDGARDSGEDVLEGITVYAIDVDTNSIMKTATTGSDGSYSLSGLEEGEYIAVFEYDTGIYNVTTYQADGVSSSKNSDAVKTSMTINNVTKIVAATDTIKLTSSVAYIDLGLIEAQSFSLDIAKYVNKITVTTTDGEKTYEQDDETTLAQVQIASRYLSGAEVTIEYTIKVTNNGEVAGYAKSIIDYVPSTLEFDSNLNSDWYKSGSYIYSSTLENTKIESGESKEITLILTKTMTDTNTGLVNNLAQIKETSNTLGLENEATNKGSADVIISVSTGGLVRNILLIISTIAIIAGLVFIINKKIITRKIRF